MKGYEGLSENFIFSWKFFSGYESGVKKILNFMKNPKNQKPPKTPQKAFISLHSLKKSLHKPSLTTLKALLFYIKTSSLAIFNFKWISSLTNNLRFTWTWNQ